jgi:hypothetical protein
MYKLKVLTAAVALLFVTPVFAQEMGGGTGPGSASGLEPTYNNRSYNGYDQAEHLRAGTGALDSYALSQGGTIPANRLKSKRATHALK